MSSARKFLAESVRAEENAWALVAGAKATLAKLEANAKQAHKQTVMVQGMIDKLEPTVSVGPVLSVEAA